MESAALPPDQKRGNSIPYNLEELPRFKAAPTDQGKGPDMMKAAYKYYKKKKPQVPDLSKVLDVAKAAAQGHLVDGLELVPNPRESDFVVEENRFEALGLKHPRTWQVCKFVKRSKVAGALGQDRGDPDPSPDGFVGGQGAVLISNPFTESGHIRWSLRCLRDYARTPPNRTNLDNTLGEVKARNRRKVQSQGGPPDGGADEEALGVAADPFWWWERVAVEKDSLYLKDSLRWATLGYHHDWDTKKYTVDGNSPFPEELGDMVRTLVREVELRGLPLLCPGQRAFKAEAAIVNFYPVIDSGIGPHTDHSEPNRKAPLVSVSFGRPAIFLLGGPHRQTDPAAFLLRSGDVLIMTAEARNSFHAVPRILEDELILQNQHLFPGLELPSFASSGAAKKKCCEGYCDDETFCAEYLDDHRININVRQVF